METPKNVGAQHPDFLIHNPSLSISFMFPF